MTDYKTRPLQEASTYEKFGEYLKDDANWSSAAACLGVLFRAMWHAALPVDRIVEIGNAMNGTTFSREVLQKELTKLVRADVLRSRTLCGVRVYEVNY